MREGEAAVGIQCEGAVEVACGELPFAKQVEAHSVTQARIAVVGVQRRCAVKPLHRLRRQLAVIVRALPRGHALHLADGEAGVRIRRFQRVRAEEERELRRGRGCGVRLREQRPLVSAAEGFVP